MAFKLSAQEVHCSFDPCLTMERKAQVQAHNQRRSSAVCILHVAKKKTPPRHPPLWTGLPHRHRHLHQQQQHRCHPICHQPQITHTTHTFTYSYILRCNWNVSDNWLASSTAWFKAAAESAAGASHVQKSSRVPMSSNDLTGLDGRDYKD